MKEKKQLEIETKIASTNNQREAKVDQSQGPSGKVLVTASLATGLPGADKNK